MTMRLSWLGVILGLAGMTATVAGTDLAGDRWSGLRFLLGEWTGVGSGKPGDGTGGFSFVPDLEGKVLVRRNRSDYPPKSGEAKGTHHEDLMVVFPGPAGLEATYWDNEGHVIRYTITTPAAGSAVFESDPAAPGPRFRLEYSLVSNGDLAIKFSIAPPPGKSFQEYLTATARRVPEGKGKTSP